MAKHSSFNGEGLMPLKNCAYCGVGFTATNLWVYKRNDKYFHTYSCMRSYDKIKEERKAESKLRQREKQQKLYRERHGLQLTNS